MPACHDPLVTQDEAERGRILSEMSTIYKSLLSARQTTRISRVAA